jgi:hypothetical protein
VSGTRRFTCFFTNAPACCDAGISWTTSFAAAEEEVETIESDESVRDRGK